jgi:fimbrial chaperone protein
MNFRSILPLILFSLFCAGVNAEAASLQVYPVNIEGKAPTSAAVLTLRNLEDQAASTQIRVFKWSQRDGKDVLEPTQAVVASPPAVKLKPNTNYTIRIVRLDHSPIVGEESYRLLVDQIPDMNQIKAGAVNLEIRYSIPVFFSHVPKVPNVSWSLVIRDGHMQLTGINAGQRHAKITNLTVTDSKGQILKFGNGLLGYVLGGALQQFNSRALPAGYASGGKFLIKYSTENGPAETTVTSPGAN